MNEQTTQASEWENYPIGPQTRMYMGLEADMPADYEPFSAEAFARFQDFMAQFVATHPAVSATELVNLMEEFVQMGIGQLAVKIYKASPEFDLNGDFRAMLHLGSGALVDQDFDLAKSSFARAQELVPEEPAPYVNLARLYFHLQQDELCEKWIMGGLDADPNYFGLWEILGLLFQHRFQSAAGQKLRDFAVERHSWAGLSLSALLIDADDKLLRSQFLEPVFESGNRTLDFLVEYTAALGAAGDYEKIPAIVWEAERSGEELPWQLLAHCAQALVGLSKEVEAEAYLRRALAARDISESAQNELIVLLDEIQNREQTSTSPDPSNIH